jgi:methylated-DNA-[protein]-cysteine S-methyltransferase
VIFTLERVIKLESYPDNLQWRAIATKLGSLAVAYSNEGVYALELPGYHKVTSRIQAEDPQWLWQLAGDLQAYFLGRKVSFTCPIADTGYSPFFRRALWAAAKIPYGECRSYSWVAAQANSPLAVRAVGQAMSRNRTPLLIPCHRVICKDGSLGGFGYGLSWKQKLLQLEHTAREDL